ncbi:MAG: FHA domain-containing protein [Bacteroidaceae bacterium]|nr:FHA domain-containing protein [Bacteroidaceae bacterium]
MKRVRCPKCDHYITFDETRYVEGQTLVFECPECHRQFGVRIGSSHLMGTRSQERQQAESQRHEEIAPTDCGTIIVVENVFHFQQTLHLEMGDNVIGRYVRGTNINKPIETVDPSVDTTHCIINVRQNRQGEFIYTLRDAPSGTGTFVGNTILHDNDRLRIENGTIITIGATTLILRAAGCDDEETTAQSRRP